MSEMTVEQHREVVREEYSKYVATQVIDINGVRAFNPGDAVPAGHVDGYSRPEVVDGKKTGKTEKIAPVVSKDQVTGANTQAAAAASKES